MWNEKRFVCIPSCSETFLMKRFVYGFVWEPPFLLVWESQIYYNRESNIWVCFTKKASVLSDTFCFEHMFNVWMLFYAQNIFASLCVVMIMSSIVTLHRWAKTMMLSRVGMAVPWSHLYTVLPVVNPHAIWTSLWLFPFDLFRYLICSVIRLFFTID
jgi:hypothetical protein